ncbi:hypothetical protein YC2023_046001 [Brassica napus]
MVDLQEHRLTSAVSPPYPNPFREPLVLKRHMLWSEPKLFMELKLADCYKLELIFFLRSIMSVYSLPLRLSAKGSPSPKPVKSRTFIFSGSVEIHLVSSWNLDVGARAVHALSTSFQTLQFCIINVGFDYFMLVIVTYSGIHLMLPTILQWMSKTLSFSFVITCFMLYFMIIKPSRIPLVLILLSLSLAPDVMV